MGNFVDDDHALLTGIVLGMLLKAGLPVYMSVDEHQDYAPVLHLRLDMGDPEPLDVLIEVKP